MSVLDRVIKYLENEYPDSQYIVADSKAIALTAIYASDYSITDRVLKDLLFLAHTQHVSFHYINAFIHVTQKLRIFDFARD